MSIYQLVDSNGATYSMPSDVFTRSGDSWQADISLIERSFRDGAVFPGIMRIKSSEMSFSYPQNNIDDASYRSALNTILMWMLKAVKIRDTTLNIETDILMSKAGIKYDNGSFLRSSDNTLTFKQLNPHWEDVSYTEINLSGSVNLTLGTRIINNSSYKETPLLITITYTGIASYILFQIAENNQGIYIGDSGIIDQTVYIIDNKTGIITLNGVKRNQLIAFGTGFFMMPPTIGTLYYETDGNAAIKIQYKNRVFI